MEEWHVSDSEEEEDVRDTHKLFNARLEGLSALAKKDSKTFLDQPYIPRNLIDLYERIANEGFITLNCHGSKCSVERKNEKTENIGEASTVNNENTSKVVEESTVQKT